MVIIFYLLLLLGVNWCTDHRNFVTTTAGVGQNVTLRCPRLKSDEQFLYWIRFVSGDWPESLGGTFIFDYDEVNKTPHTITKQENGTFILQIDKTKLSDTGLYYCVKVDDLDMMFVEGIFLRIKEPESGTDIIQMPPSDSIHSGDPVAFQCSVLSDYQNKPCTANHSVYWFRAGPDGLPPRFLYVHGNSGDECERTPEISTAQKCFYNFTKNVSSSDAGTYYCAVDVCGEITFGKGTKLDVKEFSMWDLQKANIVLCLLCAVLATSVVANVFLINVIKKKTCDCCADAVTADCDQQRQQTAESSLVYVAPVFNKRKTGKTPRKMAKEETVYNDVSAFVID
ncbi:signal-regulatory protein beta-2-like isoform 1-T1 [Pholidichthys leucotaenia]